MARPDEIAARLRAYDAAKESVDTGQSGRSMARKHNLPLGSVNFAALVLRNGTPEEIELLKTGEYSHTTLYHAVRKRLSPEGIARQKSEVLARPRPNQFKDRRARAMEAAEAVRRENLSYNDAAVRFDLNRQIINEAHTILIGATPEELEQLRAGNLAMRVVYKNIMARGGVSERKKGVRSSATKDEVKVESLVWSKLTDALDNIVGMPAPTDVVRLVKKNGIRARQVDKSLMSAFSWITEFADAWTK